MAGYRDDLEAARLRIETLVLQIDERDAALRAREAELAELRAEHARAGSAKVPEQSPRASTGLLVGLALAILGAGIGFSGWQAAVRDKALARAEADAGSRRVSAELEETRARLEEADRARQSAELALANLQSRQAGSLETPTPGALPRGNEFNRGAASATLSAAADRAKACGKAGGPTGTGKVSLTFAPSGRVTSATVTGPFAGTPVGSCIANQFKAASVPAFEGAPVNVTKTVHVSASPD